MNCNGIQFGLACFIMVALTGLTGFIIVYHYATFERPMQQFAIVTDAGSTQTRSSLFTVSLNSGNLNRWLEQDEDTDPAEADQRMPLASLFQVQQVSSCLNGGPVAALQSESGATNLTLKCLRKFSQHIKRLDFLANNEEPDPDDSEDELGPLDSEEVSRRMAGASHRVNSMTHFYLGATAGMRALSQLNATRAREKILWMERALNESNRLLARGPFINKAFLDIIDGSDEAGFGWLSVNFVCDKLEVQRRPLTMPHYSLLSSNGTGPQQVPAPASQVGSVGTLELGGASAQMAYQVPDQFTESAIEMSGLEPKRLELFNAEYQLATRSDLCLGMSQAVLRTNYVLLRQWLGPNVNRSSTSTSIELANACMQNRSSLSLSGSQLADIFGAPCLAADGAADAPGNQAFKDFIAAAKEVRFVGLGNATQCDQLLSALTEPQLCNKYFSLCPTSKNRQPPPTGMPFVTISGYNKALLVLDLQREQVRAAHELEQTIADQLGGYSIDKYEFANKTREFCALDVAQFPDRFPKMNKAFYSLNCLQLVYINKLLTEFYRFESAASWNQIKFLLFPVKQSQSKQEGPAADKNDIGWTLGLLLNATSQRLADDLAGEQFIFYHHGASLAFIMRTTIFLMLACTLLAIGFLGTAILAVQRRRRRGQAYMNRSYEDSI